MRYAAGRLKNHATASIFAWALVLSLACPHAGAAPAPYTVISMNDTVMRVSGVQTAIMVPVKAGGWPAPPAARSNSTLYDCTWPRFFVTVHALRQWSHLNTSGVLGGQTATHWPIDLHRSGIGRAAALPVQPIPRALATPSGKSQPMHELYEVALQFRRAGQPVVCALRQWRWNLTHWSEVSTVRANEWCGTQWLWYDSLPELRMGWDWLHVNLLPRIGGGGAEIRVLASNSLTECGLLANQSALMPPNQSINSTAVHAMHSSVPGPAGLSWSSPLTIPAQLPPLPGIATGYGHSCAVYLNGSAVCWGEGSGGQLGSGSTADAGVPGDSRLQANGRSFARISAGKQHTCAVFHDGTAACWGVGSDWRLGYSTDADVHSPSSLQIEAGGRQFVDIAAGSFHSCAVFYSGDAVCWGSGLHGRLGQGSADPVKGSQLPGLSIAAGGRLFAAISAGPAHTCALFTDGTATCWGDGSNGVLGLGSIEQVWLPGNHSIDAAGRTFSQISAGGFHTCATFSDGSAACWGMHFEGRLGLPVDSNVLAPANLSIDAAGRRFASISAGSYHSCGVFESGGAVCWGSGTDGRLGTGSTATIEVPGSASIYAQGRSFVDIRAGNSQSCALLQGGDVVCWGGALPAGNGQPLLQPGSATTLHTRGQQLLLPQHALYQPGLPEVVAGYAATCMLLAGGELRCWDESDPLYTQSPTAQLDTGGRAVHQVAMGFEFACAVFVDASAACWGEQGANKIAREAVQIVDAPGSHGIAVGGREFVSVTAGSQHACGMFSDGTAVCWGSQRDGRLGNGMDAAELLWPPYPTAINVGGRQFIQVSAGGDHTCGVFDDGSATCWGGNIAGQLGRVSGGSVLTPGANSIQAGGRKFARIAAGIFFSCGVFRDGNATCWGVNLQRQTGLNSTQSQVNVPGSSTIDAAGRVFEQISAASAHACAVFADGSAACWGTGPSGELGAGPLQQIATPAGTAIDAGGRRFLSITAGRQHSCAVFNDGSVACWGNNQNAQLGYQDGAAVRTPGAQALAWRASIQVQPDLVGVDVIQVPANVKQLELPLAFDIERSPLLWQRGLSSLPATATRVLPVYGSSSLDEIPLVNDVARCPTYALSGQTEGVSSSVFNCVPFGTGDPALGASTRQAWQAMWYGPVSATLWVVSSAFPLSPELLWQQIASGSSSSILRSEATLLQRATSTQLVVMGNLEAMWSDRTTIFAEGRECTDMKWLSPRAVTCLLPWQTGAVHLVHMRGPDVSHGILGTADIVAGQLRYFPPRVLQVTLMPLQCLAPLVEEGTVEVCEGGLQSTESGSVQRDSGAHVLGGTLLRISGEHFGAFPSSDTVSITVGTLPCPLVSEDALAQAVMTLGLAAAKDTLLWCLAPAWNVSAWGTGLAAQSLQVQVADQASNKVMLEYSGLQWASSGQAAVEVQYVDDAGVLHASATASDFWGVTLPYEHATPDRVWLSVNHTVFGLAGYEAARAVAVTAAGAAEAQSSTDVVCSESGSGYGQVLAMPSNTSQWQPQAIPQVSVACLSVPLSSLGRILGNARGQWQMVIASNFEAPGVGDIAAAAAAGAGAGTSSERQLISATLSLQQWPAPSILDVVSLRADASLAALAGQPGNASAMIPVAGGVLSLQIAGLPPPAGPCGVCRAFQCSMQGQRMLPEAGSVPGNWSGCWVWLSSVRVVVPASTGFAERSVSCAVPGPSSVAWDSASADATAYVRCTLPALGADVAGRIVQVQLHIRGGSVSRAFSLQAESTPQILALLDEHGDPLDELSRAGGLLQLQIAGLAGLSQRPVGQQASNLQRLHRISVGNAACVVMALHPDTGTAQCQYPAGITDARVQVESDAGLTAAVTSRLPLPEVHQVTAGAELVPCALRPDHALGRPCPVHAVQLRGAHLGMVAAHVALSLQVAGSSASSSSCNVSTVNSSSVTCYVSSGMIPRGKSFTLIGSVHDASMYVRPSVVLAGLAPLRVETGSASAWGTADSLTLSGSGFGMQLGGEIVDAVAQVTWAGQQLRLLSTKEASIQLSPPANATLVAEAAIVVTGLDGAVDSSWIMHAQQTQLHAAPALLAVVRQLGKPDVAEVRLTWPEQRQPGLFEARIAHVEPGQLSSAELQELPRLYLDSGGDDLATGELVRLLQGIRADGSIWLAVRGNNGGVNVGPWSEWQGPAHPRCLPGQFRLALQRQNSTTCAACPPGRDCSVPELSAHELGVLPGWAVPAWTATHPGATAVPCPVPAACLGVSPTNASASGSSTTSESAVIAAQCAPGYVGVLCASCGRGFAARPGGECVACTGGVAGSAVVLVLGAALLIAGLGWMIVQEVRAVDVAVGDSDVLKKVLINHAQLTGMCTGLRIDWPQPAQAWLRCNDAASSLGELFIAPECLSDGESAGTPYGGLAESHAVPAPLWRSLLIILLPLVVLAVLASTLLLRTARGSNRLPAGRAQLWAVAGGVVVVYVLYSPVTRAALSLFACREVGSGAAAQERWDSDWSVACDHPLLASWRLGLGLPALGFITAGFPVVAGGWLWSRRAVLSAGPVATPAGASAAAGAASAAAGAGAVQPAQASGNASSWLSLRRSTGLLWLGYRAAVAPWWEGIVLARKVVVTTAIVVAAPAGVHVQVFVGALALVPAFVLQARLRPYEHARHNALEEMHMAAALVTLVCGLFVGNVAPDSASAAAAACIAVLANLAFLAVWGLQAWVVARAMWHTKRHKLASTSAKMSGWASQGAKLLRSQSVQKLRRGLQASGSAKHAVGDRVKPVSTSRHRYDDRQMRVYANPLAPAGSALARAKQPGSTRSA